MRLSEVRWRDVQDFADRLYADGVDPSTIKKNTLNPLQVIIRRTVNRDEVPINPTNGLELPAVRGRRDRTASPAEAAALVAALPEENRALWAMVFYAGLRRGELRALRWVGRGLEGDGDPRRAITRRWGAQEAGRGDRARDCGGSPPSNRLSANSRRTSSAPDGMATISSLARPPLALYTLHGEAPCPLRVEGRGPRSNRTSRGAAYGGLG
jgi:hypothetical protein